MTSETILETKRSADFFVKERSIAPAKSNYRAETLSGGVEVIDEIAGEWIELCEEGASNEPFFRPEWFRSFVRNFESEILLITVKNNGKLRAVLPLVRKREKLHGLPVTKLCSVFNLQSQRFDLIHPASEDEKTEILQTLWNEIKRLSKWNVFETRLTYRTSWLGELLALVAAENYQTGIWEMDDAPYVTLPAGVDKPLLIENYFSSLSKNRRKLLSRNLRRLQETGAVEFSVKQGYSKDLIEKYFALEAKSWKSAAGTDVNSDARIAQLHRDFAIQCAQQDALFIHELKLDGRTIAMYIAIAFEENRTIGWKMSYDQDYAQFSPGNVLFKEVLSECMRRGSTELDMLSPANYNKDLFASGRRAHAAFYIFKKNPFASLMYFWTFTVAENLRRYKLNNTK